MDKLDALLEDAPPGDLTQFLEFINHKVYNDYFFHNLQRYDWLPALLRENCYFQESIERYPARLAYLYNIAHLYFDDIVRILANLQFDTPQTQSFFTQILRKLPRNSQRVLLSKIETWDLTEKDYTMYEIRGLVGDLLGHPNPQGLDEYLTRYLLSPRYSEKLKYSDPRPKISAWEYREFLDNNKNQLSEKSWFISTLLDLLAEFNQSEEYERFSRFSFTSFTHLNQTKRPHEDEALPILLKAFQDELNTNPSDVKFRDAWLSLQSRPQALFTRLRLLLLAAQPNAPQTFIEEALLDRFAFEEFPEYEDAVRVHFPRLSREAQRTVWSWVTTPLAVESRFLAETDPYAQGRAERVLLRRLSRLAPHLSPDLQVEWDRLQTLHSQQRESGPKMRTREGTSSSVTTDMLAAKSIPEVIQLLQGEAPSTGDDWFDQPHLRVEGLADVVRQDAIQRPGEYLRHTDLLKTIDPTYLWHILDAYRSNDVKDVPIWTSYLEMFDFVCNQSQQKPSVRDWTFCVGTMADYLEKALKRDDIVDQLLPQAQAIGAVLAKALLDPDPPPDSEIENLGDYGDAFTRSLNVTRGKVMHALIRFLGMVQTGRSKGDHPELQRVLDEGQTLILNHLNRERSGAVAAAVVPTLPWFEYHDAAYAAKLAQILFDRAVPWRSSATWSTHLQWNRFYSRVFELLRSSYAQYAREDLGAASPIWDTNEQVQKEYAEHIGMFFVRGLITFGQPDELLEHFLRKTTGAALANLFAFMGQALERTDGDVRAYVANLQQLWAAVKSGVLPARPEEDQREIRASFVWLLGNSQIELSWRLNELRSIAGLPRSGQNDFILIKTLTEFPDTERNTILNIIALLVEAQPLDGMAVRYVKQLLEQVREDDSPEVGRAVNIIVNQQLARGYIGDFRPLYRPGAPPKA
ncbi:hypothetical protein K7W42_12875 [Deinococcus sp. HMF7604]|uniref:hypothetical protein n=1 Tax=Deinococcus betulae TaxID=2873312 RepID=UPI001CCBA8AB|nr:hypothetical protein [Deinococcus betulae]MBZ9751750.1 hypothetical protein [Deinococcus betulae]